MRSMLQVTKRCMENRIVVYLRKPAISHDLGEQSFTSTIFYSACPQHSFWFSMRSQLLISPVKFDVADFW